MELKNTSLFNDSNLISYYRMEGNSNDSKGSNNGSDTSVTYSASYGKFGQGASFNGTTSMISLGDVNAFELTNNFTVFAWVKSGANGAFQGIVGKAQETTYQGWNLAKESDNKYKFIMFNGNAPGYHAATANSASTDTTNWIFLAGVRDSGTATIYINATAQTTTTTQAPLAATSQPALIGRYYGNTNNYYWNGYIDEVAIFNRALSATEISNYYNGLLPPAFTPKVNFFL